MVLPAQNFLSSAYKLYRSTTRQVFLAPKQLTMKGISYELIIVLTVWLLEWAMLIEYIIGEWWRSYIIFPVRLPLLLIVCLGYWFFLWGMAVWRRTQYGKFTRGERKLWAKALTAFWVAELVTAVSFVLIYFWMSWGPMPLVPRIFAVSRKGIIIELIIYSYMIFLAYIAKLTLKWNLWQTQICLTLLIVIIFSYLLWKDVLILLMRDNMYFNSNARWRNLRRTAVIYSLSHEWWVQHITTTRAPHSLFENLDLLITSQTKPNFSQLPAALQYEHNLYIDIIPKTTRANHLFPVLNVIIDYANRYPLLNEYFQNQGMYPRRTGFVPKRLSMWQFLVILKMWHHLIILLWWTLYLFKLNTRKKTSYSIVSVCTFNIYCCFILALAVYTLYLVNTWALAFKFRPGVFNIHRWCLWTTQSLNYNYRLLTILTTDSAVISFFF